MLHNEADIPKPFNVWRRETNFVSIYFLLLYRGEFRHDGVKALLFNFCEKKKLSTNGCINFVDTKKRVTLEHELESVMQGEAMFKF